MWRSIGLFNNSLICLFIVTMPIVGWGTSPQGTATFVMPPQTEVYLTVLPDWTVGVGSQLNFTCSLSTPLANSVLFLALITNSSLLNIVQVRALTGALISGAYANRVAVYIYDTLDSAVFVFSNVLPTDAGAYMCYTKTAYSFVYDSNTVTINVFNTLLSSTTPSDFYDTSFTTPPPNNSQIDTSASSSGQRPVLIIALACSGSVALIMLIVIPILIVRHHKKQRLLKQRLRMLEVSRQQSLEEQAQTRRSDPAKPNSNNDQSHNHNQPIPAAAMYCRQHSNGSDTYCFNDVQPSYDQSSSSVYHDRLCVIRKTDILQKVDANNSTSQVNLARPTRNHSTGRNLPKSTAVPVLINNPVNNSGHATVNEQRQLACSSVQSASTSQQGEAVAAFDRTSQHPVCFSDALRLRSKRMPDNGSREPQSYLPNVGPTAKESIPAQTSSSGQNQMVEHTKTMTVTAQQGDSQRTVPDHYSPPSYNQVLLSNEAVALFGDSLRIPRPLSTNLSQTFPSNSQFVPNELYNVGLPYHSDKFSSFS